MYRMTLALPLLGLSMLISSASAGSAMGLKPLPSAAAVPAGRLMPLRGGSQVGALPHPAMSGHVATGADAVRERTNEKAPVQYR